MTVYVGETWTSRKLSDNPQSPSAELHFQIFGDAGEDLNALALARASAPPSFLGLHLQGVELTPVDAGVWEATATYGRRNQSSSTYTFEISGETVHITQAKETVAAYNAAGPFAPDNKGVIGITHDRVEGADILVPVYRFTERHNFPIAALTFEYRKTLFNLYAKVNDAPFRGFAAGEVLFEGASGTDEDAGHLEGTPWETVPIDFRFAASPNVEDVVIGDITVAEKKGWELLDVRYQDAENNAEKRLIKKPIAVYVHRVYDEGDFSLLGIGS